MSRSPSGTHICHWRHAYLFDNIFRRLIHNPPKILNGLVKPGMTVLDLGCGMGFFSIAMAKLVGPSGKVYSLDIQPEMLEVLGRRAERAGVRHLIQPICCNVESLELDRPVDFVLAMWMVHEVPDQTAFMKRVGTVLRSNGRLLVAEPRFHVSKEALAHTVSLAEKNGFVSMDPPGVTMSRTALLIRNT